MMPPTRVQCELRRIPLPLTLVNKQGESLLFVPELSEGCAPGLRLWIGAKPQRDVSGLHSPPHHLHHLVAESLQICLVAELRREGLHGLSRIVLVAVEEPIYERLDTPPEGREQSRY